MAREIVMQITSFVLYKVIHFAIKLGRRPDWVTRIGYFQFDKNAFLNLAMADIYCTQLTVDSSTFHISG